MCYFVTKHILKPQVIWFRNYKYKFEYEVVYQFRGIDTSFSPFKNIPIIYLTINTILLEKYILFGIGISIYIYLQKVW
ncbi:hypothetical protein CFB3_18470 [Clostridium folliculivorans]|uniref:Uncharacterized protein n=1 Tax=Clostridium folliculivorans TaxID=2886038 RepID=A0A9W6D904_9CLOT|nr:hypothetical protein CFOLD11_04500 [Clostridium folliculivorans]GKU29740.1 hypothetical protein CFB3_18470 [Clostridium folliculivorans]